MNTLELLQKNEIGFVNPDRKKTSATAPAHLGYLDGLRALAALYVVFGHAGLQVILPSNSIANLLDVPFRRGHYAVDLFIVLSGFCLMLPVVRNKGILRDNALQFFKKRAKRILPPYYLAMGLCLLLMATLINKKTGTAWDQSIPVTKWSVFTHTLLIQDLFEKTFQNINYVFWSISVEWRIYFLFPLLVLCWRKFGAFTTTVATILLSFVLLIALHPLHPKIIYFGLNGANLHLIGLFTLGMLAAQISFPNKAMVFIRIRDNFPWIKALLITLFVTIIADLKNVHWTLLDLLVGITATCLLVAVSSGKLSLVHRFLSWKPLVFTGTFAYSIYLIHAPILQLISQYVITPLNLSPLSSILFLFLLGTPLIIGASYLFFLIAERPFIKKKKVEAAKVAL